jgi:hypothetical protein
MRVGAIEPVGMMNASATKDLKSSARMNATAKLSRVSRKTWGGGLSDAVPGVGFVGWVGSEVDEAIVVRAPSGRKRVDVDRLGAGQPWV